MQYSIGAFCSFLELLVSCGSKCQGDSGGNHGHDFHPGATESGVRAGQTDAMDSVETGLLSGCTDCGQLCSRH